MYNASWYGTPTVRIVNVNGYWCLRLTTEVFYADSVFFFRLRFPADRGPDMYGTVPYHINANVDV
jgi:hypothetical protein